MTTYEILVAARALISDPERWTTGVPARAEDGRMCDPDAPAAVCWCALGALGAVSGDDAFLLTPAYEALWDSARALYSTGVAGVNDEMGHAAVLRIYTLAMEDAR